MAYLYIADNCKGTEIKFIESNGELLHKRRKLFGGITSGSIALQDRGNGKMCITFCDLKNLAVAMGKEAVSVGKMFLNPGDRLNTTLNYLNSNSLCAFTFDKNDLKTGNVVIKYQVQFAGVSYYAGLMCYDMRTHLGCSYIFDSSDEVEKWAKEIGINKVEYLDAYGKVTEIEEL